MADIGATHARFALETAPVVLRSVCVLRCDDYTGIVPLLHSYLADHEGTRINHGAFALANPISGDMIRMTNRDWQFFTDEVRRELGLNTLLIVNDFTALAMSLPGLSGQDLMQVGGGEPSANAVIGVLGPGTGSVIVIAKRSIIDIPTAVIAVVTIALLWKFKKLQEPVVVVAAALIGLVVYPLTH